MQIQGFPNFPLFPVPIWVCVDYHITYYFSYIHLYSSLEVFTFFCSSAILAHAGKAALQKAYLNKFLKKWAHV